MVCEPWSVVNRETGDGTSYFPRTTDSFVLLELIEVVKKRSDIGTFFPTTPYAAQPLLGI